MQGKTVVITGGTSGIGEATALALAERGADLALICRSRERGAATRDRIAQHVGRDAARLFQADMARLDDVRQVAEVLSRELERIDVLLNNAGVTMLRREETHDGFETTFGVNHLAPFLLTHELLPALLKTPGARIVNVASDAHKFARFDLDDLQSERRYAAMRVYGASKLCNILFTRELARRLEGRDVSAYCLHPGAVATNLGANNGLLARMLLPALALFFRTPAQGARASIHLCSSADINAPSGSYFIDEHTAPISRLAEDDDVAERLWAESERLIGLDVGKPWC